MSGATPLLPLHAFVAGQGNSTLGCPVVKVGLIKWKTADPAGR